MQIAILVTDTIDSFGVRHMVDLCKDLSYRGHDVRLVSLLASVDSSISDELGEYHIQLSSKTSAASVFELTALMAGGAPDVIISLGLRASCVASMSKTKAKVNSRLVFFEHEVPGYELGMDAVSYNFWKWLRPKAYSSADRVIVPSYEVQRRLMLVSSVKKKSIERLFYPARGYFTPPIKAPHPWLAEARGEPTFVASGRIDRNSDFLTLIEGMRLLQSRMPAKVIILGKGPDLPRLMDRVTKWGLEDVVSFAGDVESLQDYVYFSDGFISTSIASAFPDEVVRAMEIPSRIICTASPGGSREVLNDGEFGHLLRMRDANAVSNAIYASMRKQKSRPTDRAMWRFDRDQFFESVNAILEDVMTFDASYDDIQPNLMPLEFETSN